MAESVTLGRDAYKIRLSKVDDFVFRDHASALWLHLPRYAKDTVVQPRFQIGDARIVNADPNQRPFEGAFLPEIGVSRYKDDWVVDELAPNVLIRRIRQPAFQNMNGFLGVFSKLSGPPYGKVVIDEDFQAAVGVAGTSARFLA